MCVAEEKYEREQGVPATRGINGFRDPEGYRTI
jgi:hypothetical protein